MDNESPSPLSAGTLPVLRTPSLSGPSLVSVDDAAEADAPGLTLGDVYFTLFRQKRRIILCSLIGLAMAGTLYKLRPPPYESEAKLFIRYVMENRATGPAGDTTRVKSLDSQGETILSSEIEIMTSLDLLGEVVDAVGADTLVPDAAGRASRNVALGRLARNLRVEVPPQSRVIHLIFRHEDPAVVQPVLRTLIDRYLKKHVEIHRALGITGDFLTQETDELRSRLSQTEDALRSARHKAGVISIEDAKAAASAQMARLNQEILAAEADHAERSSLVQLIGGEAAVSSEPAPEISRITPAVVDRFRQIESRLALLRRREQELLVLFTPDSTRVQEVRAQLLEVEGAKENLVTEYPRLLSYDAPRGFTSQAATFPQSVDLVAESARLRALGTKIKVLRSQLEQVKTEVGNVEQMEASIQELRRKKDLEEANYRYYSASLEQSRIDEALGAGHVSNISEIQAPSPPVRNWPKAQKMLALIALGGVFVGVGWAFLIERFFDRTIKRPIEIERLLNLPLFIAIPEVREGGRQRQLNGFSRPALPAPAASAVPLPTPAATRAAGATQPLPWDPAHALYPFHETLRDRLIAYFESIGLTHKPKLVGVTGLTRNAGVTTIAAGLAQRLSETGAGNVLLVDMTVGQGSAQQFIQGKPVCDLDELLDTRDNAHVAEKLYVVSENSRNERLSRNLPQRFSKLVPRLKASDFDFIILDMPPVSQISVTPRLAGFMDMVLLVIESEKSDRDVVRRATALLSDSQARIGTVLNRVHTYVPSRLYQDSLSDL